MNGASLLDVGHDVLGTIFKLLTVEDRCKLGATCRQCMEIFLSPHIWDTIDLRSPHGHQIGCKQLESYCHLGEGRLQTLIVQHAVACSVLENILGDSEVVANLRHVNLCATPLPSFVFSHHAQVQRPSLVNIEMDLLSRLPHLTTLEVNADALLGVSDVVEMPRLQRLCIWSRGTRSFEFSCNHLRELELHFAEHVPSGLLRLIAAHASTLESVVVTGGRGAADIQSAIDAAEQFPRLHTIVATADREIALNNVLRNAPELHTCIADGRVTRALPPRIHTLGGRLAGPLAPSAARTIKGLKLLNSSITCLEGMTNITSFEYKSNPAGCRSDVDSGISFVSFCLPYCKRLQELSVTFTSRKDNLDITPIITACADTLRSLHVGKGTCASLSDQRLRHLTHLSVEGVITDASEGCTPVVERVVMKTAFKDATTLSYVLFASTQVQHLTLLLGRATAEQVDVVAAALKQWPLLKAVRLSASLESLSVLETIHKLGLVV
ncbi:hypothetical protein PTSG_08814 [Salpingoeca rosetta]|uniref:F-box domain-containing protein n=1 Tax=Salpingoeca rosetta (strain ATCC 50818 / BSB-021) TaxID=946362 RepID=F2UKS4_SALR5|nr:uncharacterized protein PTSG_08814 [Salpingoeca rosetta]EGD77723.1 hypothetical protein PTSG_08814 [Salpingoeca rosetta]|eukprot:XP_004990199.1 hypothetical protein PTSG_08814 [Salpingoeca rosetta]